MDIGKIEYPPMNHCLGEFIPPPTTRDQWRYHFAGLAMQGLLGRTDGWEELIAEEAVSQADAILAELEKAK